jgi:membrane protein
MVRQDGTDHAASVERATATAAPRGGHESLTVTKGLARTLVRDVIAELRRLDVVDQAVLFGAGLLISLLPFLILLSAFASRRVDDDIALRLGLDNRAAGIVSHLFNTSSVSLNAATVTSVIFVAAGMLAVASSLQQIYEKAFHQQHRGMQDVPRRLAWVVALCGVVALESVVGRPVRDAAAGSGLVELVTFAIFMPFFWWTTHFLLRGRIGWRRLLPSAVATGVGFVGLGVFSKFYFSSSIISDDRTYGAIGAVFSLMTWLIAIGVVIMLGAVAGAVWEGRRS